MGSPATVEQFLELARKSGLVAETALAGKLAALREAVTPSESPQEWARALVEGGLLTRFQAEQLLLGKSRGFTLANKYRLLEHLGSGGMGSVYLCEHLAMRRRVAIKVLPVQYAQDPSYLERFYCEARAVAALDHPNIVRAHDIDHDGQLHFLVMEYVDGSSLQDIVDKFGPLEISQAAHYICQAAEGLEHASKAGVVHRDIKPGNLLVDRTGTVKVLDMGLARYFHDDANISEKFDETVLGTSDYLAPEQTVDSNVDARADIYSLGATFYFCLTGKTLFGEGTTAQKLIWHQTRQPRPIRGLRPDVPDRLAVLIEQKMLAKEPAQRFQTAAEICKALAPWTSTPLLRPPEEQMPQLSPALSRDYRPGPPSPGPQSRRETGSGRNWTVSGTSVIRPSAPSSTGAGSRPTVVQAGSSMDTPVNLKRPVPVAKRSTPVGASAPKEPGTKATAKPFLEKKASVSKAPAPAATAVNSFRRRLWTVWMAVALTAAALAGGCLWWVINNAHTTVTGQGADQPAQQEIQE
jgi:serine/threonine protein kinase